MSFQPSAKSSQSMIPILPAHAITKGLTPAAFGYDEQIIAQKPWNAKDEYGNSRLDDYFNYGFDEKTWKMYVSRQNMVLSHDHSMI